MPESDCPRSVEMHSAAVAVRAMTVVGFLQITVDHIARDIIDEKVCGLSPDL